MTKRELLKKKGSVEQIGGVRDFTFNDGRAKGVRAIEIITGKLRFTVLPDRCMDIAQADFRGDSFSWIILQELPVNGGVFQIGFSLCRNKCKPELFCQVFRHSLLCKVILNL